MEESFSTGGALYVHKATRGPSDREKAVIPIDPGMPSPSIPSPANVVRKIRFRSGGCGKEKEAMGIKQKTDRAICGPAVSSSAKEACY